MYNPRTPGISKSKVSEKELFFLALVLIPTVFSADWWFYNGIKVLSSAVVQMVLLQLDFVSESPEALIPGQNLTQ